MPGAFWGGFLSKLKLSGAGGGRRGGMTTTIITARI
jgi:hypothetical protein